jgi:glycosyltransferase involved in cell wall biosynthesis
MLDPLVVGSTPVPVRVQVAICTWNRCSLLRQTLESFRGLRVAPHVSWDVIVVNNNCTDATADVVREFDRLLPIRMVDEPQPGLSHARNRALAVCDADYVIFTDDDVQLHEDWLMAFADACHRFPAAAAFGGPVDPWFPVQPTPELVEAFPAIRNGFCGIDHELPLGFLPPRRRLTGANMAFRASACLGIQFDPALGVKGTSLAGGEETAFITALRQRGGEVLWIPDMRLRHYVDPARMELAYLIRLARDRGSSSVRERGVPKGRQVAGAPVWLWGRLVQSMAKAAGWYVAGRRIRAAGHYAKAEHYRAKILECRKRITAPA